MKTTDLLRIPAVAIALAGALACGEGDKGGHGAGGEPQSEAGPAEPEDFSRNPQPNTMSGADSATAAAATPPVTSTP